MSAQDLHTLKLAKGSRTYFFDIAKCSNGLYLKMSCSEKKPRGFEHHRIFVFEEDLPAFVTALNESAKELKKRLQQQQVVK